jgi:hypothetical protein
MNSEKIKQICENLLNMSKHKLQYSLKTNLIEGAFKTLPHYGIELTEEVFNIFYDVVNTKLSGSEDVEYEFECEEEYNNLMNLKKLVVK